MPKPYPSEFRRDIFAVARQGGSIAAIAKEFGITESCLRNWLKKADVEDGIRHGIRGSMGRVGAAGENAAMESLFSLLQKNALNRRRWDNREELRLAILIWMERSYHRRRRQDQLGRATPVEYEALHNRVGIAT